VTTLLAIDPGQATGVALFFIGPDCAPVLMNANVFSPTDIAWQNYRPDIVVIECPERVYGKARVQDILKLAVVVGMYVERFKHARLVRTVTPHEWKGSVDGDIMVRRIENSLSPAEAKLISGITPPSKRHNAVDAVGIGKWSFRQPWMRGIL
jgi:hypothetical protein